ncbi:thiamine transport system ATP-binding protein [Cognatiyoonia koreensis]|uniref:Thiamine transport system ATP-binding protein n=1 Tax=Cognatiyoonia koreensis TaxID=364200 RepID=A0A1I0RRK3_9RHOB|nr:ATP-binding cassette domain-containing protein [Cognatiyoonia koreensis]SEW43959.1 thiamine transport system ATP-binding protein [Cognatiyoonia koreensis]
MLKLDALGLRQGDFSLTVDFECPAGLTAIIGPSGGGKSTLLAAIAGFLNPAYGSVLWNGKDLAGVAPGARPVSMLFQDNNLFPHLSVWQNVGLGLDPSLRLSPAQKDAVMQILRDVDLDGMDQRKPAALSGGQQSRVALARVLIADRPVVLLDEPFAALGPALKSGMLSLVRDMLVGAGKTVLMVTHDPDDARRFADQVIVIAGGVAHAPVPTESAFADPHPALRTYLGAADADHSK